ncbi:MAG: elongation factor Ts [Alphaproteobacteria bacterium]|nr:MAG: elongation factor Ts [Alphaproteobacteria bacterium]
MANITAALVKELREKSGAGMMDCKAALQESNGDIDAAIDWLRTKGLATAAKKAGRVASEGLVGCISGGPIGVTVEVNSETDFVARNENFQKLAGEITKIALSVEGDYEALKVADFPGAGESVEDHIKTQIGTIGENLGLRRSAGLKVDNGVVAAYVHNQAAPGLGKIGVLVALESTGDTEKLEALGRQIAMHVAATRPLAATKDELDPEVVAKERQVLIDQAKESGKPQEIAEKMVEGRIRKFFEEVVLMYQGFVMDPDRTIEKVLQDAESDVGAPVALKGFVRMELGEGIEKKEEDFAAEVAAAAGS